MRIGVDLGGTKTEIAAVSVSGETLLRRRVPTPASDYKQILDTIARLVREAERELRGTFPVGIGAPGSTDSQTGLIKNANSTILIGKPLHRDAEHALDRAVRIANDADCFTLSEVTLGAARGARTAFGVILGTGVGGGIAVRGHLIEGPNGIAGEWGHNPLPW
ncbi:MAG: ROK family protein, partial [Candidatus Eremiobacteraeota bacterium]|nr:ROK family protein [Candidatus Eremiobacteraeota bacterium]